jgi:hypothetical protein
MGTNIRLSCSVRIETYVHLSGTTVTDEEVKIIGHSKSLPTNSKGNKEYRNSIAKSRCCSAGRRSYQNIYIINIDYWQEVGRRIQSSFKNSSSHHPSRGKPSDNSRSSCRDRS